MQYVVFIWCLLVFLLSGCQGQTEVTELSSHELYPGGMATVNHRPVASFSLPSNNLAREKVVEFYAGKALAGQPWVKAPTATDARDGLGPVYNARSCLGCHEKGGRGRVPETGNEPLSDSFVRISLPGSDARLGVKPDPVYGDQLQTQSIALSHQLRHIKSGLKRQAGEVAPEAYVYIDWESVPFTYPDGTELTLRKPELRIEELGYGELNPQLLTSHRNAPPILGVGLVELIDQRDIEQLADPKDEDRDGISGRVNYVWDVDKGQLVAGRFGWKANRPANLKVVTAAAFAGDIGISNPLFPDQPCTSLQNICLAAPSGNNEQGYELPMPLLNLVTEYVRQLAVPSRREPRSKMVLQGRELFYQARCHQCHRPSFVTQRSFENRNLSEQVIWPYSDFLLHDMGDELADGRPDFLATGNEWRTAPLWGIGLNQKVNGNGELLHDARARSVEEAILWHGGEASLSRQAFVSLSAEERHALVRFVESL